MNDGDFYRDFGEASPVFVPRAYTGAEMLEARASALEDAADELARLPYVKPGAEGRAEYERALAVRRGNTDKWLRVRAEVIRNNA